MKIGRTIITIRREVGKTLHDEVDTVLREITADPTHEFRKLIAHTSRSSAKDFFGTIAEDQLGPLAELVWPLLEPRLIELLKSHTPGLRRCTVENPCGAQSPQCTICTDNPVSPTPIDPTKAVADVATLPGNTPLADKAPEVAQP